MDGIDVFPITQKIVEISRQLQGVAILLVELFLIIYVGFKALNRMDEIEWDIKLWNIALVLLSIAVWPSLVIALKEGIDVFNAFLVREVFGMTWNENFFAPSFAQLGDAWLNLDLQRGSILVQTLNFIAIFLLVLARLIIYGLYWVFLFFLIVLGPLILAKGVLMNELEAMRDLLKETIILLLWQTTYVVIFGLFEMDYFGTSQLINEGENPFIQLGKAFLFAILTFFVPSITRKYGNHLGSSFFPAGFRWGGAALGLTLLGGLFGMGRRALGFASHHGAFAVWKERAMVFEEFLERGRHQQHTRHLEAEKSHLESELNECRSGHQGPAFHSSHRDDHHGPEPHSPGPGHSPSGGGGGGGGAHPPHEDYGAHHNLPEMHPEKHVEDFVHRHFPSPHEEDHPGRHDAHAPQHGEKEKDQQAHKAPDKQDFENKRIRLLRGEKNSPKSVHIEAVGIHPSIRSKNPEAYILLLELFNMKYGNLYTIDGQWIAQDQDIPSAKDFRESIPEDLRSFLRLPEEDS